MLKFNILFDNYTFDCNLEAFWGFSTYIQTPDKNILFDTGSNGRILLQNAEKMGLDFKDIDIVFISHNHWDHIGGIDTVLEENPNVILIVPNTLSKYQIKDLRRLSKDLIVVDKFTKFTNTIYSTGMMGSETSEQALILDIEDELYIVTGCGHMGIPYLLQNLPINKPVKYILGGFHMLHKNTIEAKAEIEYINPEYITATHCSGETAIGMLKIKYKERFVAGGVGAKIKF